VSQGTYDPGRPDPKKSRDEEALKLLRWLFNRFCDEEKVAPPMRAMVEPAYFCGWLDQELILVDAQETCERADVDYSVWQFLREVLDGGMAPERLRGVWYNVCMGDRPLPKVRLEKFTLTLCLHFADGTIMPTQIMVHEDMTDQPGFNDGLAASILQSRFPSLLQMIAEVGLDGLYARGDNFRGKTPEDPLDVLTGTVIKVLPQLAPEYHPYLRRYLQFLHSFCNPQLDEHAQKALREHKRRLTAAQQPPPPPAGPTGGFEV
jgi:hypothetical protein